MTSNERIKILRVLSGRTIQEMAALAQLQPAQLQSYEKGVYKPRAETGAALARALNVSSDFLFGGYGQLTAQAWSIPANSRTEQRTCADIAELLPGLLQEMGINQVIAIMLQGGDQVFFMGREGILDKMLIAESPAIARACLAAMGAPEIEFYGTEIVLHISDLHSDNLDELLESLPIKPDIKAIRRHIAESLAYQQQHVVSLRQDILASIYRLASARKLTPEQYAAVCAKLAIRASIRESDIVAAMDDI